MADNFAQINRCHRAVALDNALKVRETFSEVAIFVSASETHNKKNVNRSIAESMADNEVIAKRIVAEDLRCAAVIATSYGCPFEGKVPMKRVLDIAEQFAAAGASEVSVIDTKLGTVTETIMTALFPRSPEGSTPDAVAVAPDGKSLYVANADNNCVAVIDISVPNQSQVKGFIPTGWYPTAVAVTPDSKTLLVGVGKGNQSRANPRPQPEATKNGEPTRPRPFPYIGTLMSGALDCSSSG